MLKNKQKTKNFYNKLLLFLFITLGVINFTGCFSYSFTGASVPEHLKSIAIPISEDRSGSGQPGLSELLTNSLTQKFIDDNTLQVTEKNKANAILNCSIITLSDAPTIISGGEKVETRRVTISVQAVYRDLVKRKTIFEKNFSEYGDYPSGGSMSSRNDAIQNAVDKISEDILLDVVSGW
jgi:Lipopolysaccharide-assembly